MLTVRTSENTVITSFRLISERQDFSSVRTGENTVRARARIHIIISDLHAGNMMIYCDEAGNIKRLIVVDGFGSPEAIPLAKYFRYFGRKKIDRQWAKFRRTFDATWQRRRGGKQTISF